MSFGTLTFWPGVQREISPVWPWPHSRMYSRSTPLPCAKATDASAIIANAAVVTILTAFMGSLPHKRVRSIASTRAAVLPLRASLPTSAVAFPRRSRALVGESLYIRTYCGSDLLALKPQGSPGIPVDSGRRCSPSLLCSHDSHDNGLSWKESAYGFRAEP